MELNLLEDKKLIWRSERVLTIVWICVWSYVGVAARVLLNEASTAIEDTQGAPTILTSMGLSYFLANVFGCFVMGFAQPVKTKEHEAFWTGVTTGFCGCCTTFASWEIDLAQQYLGQMAANATIMFLVQLTTSIASFIAGRHVGLYFNPTHGILKHWKKALDHANKMAQKEDDVNGQWQMAAQALNSIEFKTTLQSNIESPSVWIVYFIALLITILVVLLAAFLGEGYLAVAFGPFGALLRYVLGLRFNKSKDFPVGTLIANVAASILDAIAVVAMPMSSEWVKQALMTGFCGSLSTVSSWMNEIYGIESTYHHVGYIATTHVITQTICLLILGLAK
ncbi:hypothetical protein THRCLA_04255 [Thraustotheca clavata]|uniref:Fluoride ion transporter CrcB n=1 Tax=Thraustotheca clavata TaxID=74557 RepID=A0A1V9ZZI1_9STRA|nr:hypothetical protein THRCLA_04255 [Thraustotheca clavata]